MKRKFLLLISIAVLLAAALAGGSSFSWLPGAELTNPVISASVMTSYFEAGDGSEEYPFIIHTPRHLYNLAWLQYSGAFNQEVDSDGNLKQYYFKLCDGDWEYSDGTKTTCGGCGGDGSYTLDMTGWTLPPVGNKTYPFISHFGCFKQGEGEEETTDHVVTIANLHISGCYADLSDPAMLETEFIEKGAYLAGDTGDEGCDIVGLFGVIGNIDGQDPGKIGSSTYDTTIASVMNFKLEGSTITSGTEHTLSGIVAGYANGIKTTIQDVQILSQAESTESVLNAVYKAENSSGESACTVLDSGITSNISDYTTVGYCNSAMLGTLEKLETKYYTPIAEAEITSSEAGSGNAWGGSLDLTKMYKRIDNVIPSSTETTKYIYYAKGATKNADGSSDIDDLPESSVKKADYYHVAATGEGSYTLSPGSFTTGIQYKHLSGGVHVEDGTVYYTKTTNGYVVSDGTNYMNLAFVNNQPVITNGKDMDTSTKWIFATDDGTATLHGNLYAVNNQTRYYLYIDTSGTEPALAVSSDTTKAIEWSITVDKDMKGKLKSSSNLYVIFDGTNWILIGNTLIYATVGGERKYLGIADGSVGERQTDWFFNSTGSNTWTISATDANNKTWYLSAGGTDQDLEELTLVDSASAATKWSVDTTTQDITLTVTAQTDTDGTKYTRTYLLAYYNGWKLAYYDYLLVAEKEGSAVLGVADSGKKDSDGKAILKIVNANNCRWIDEDLSDNTPAEEGGPTYKTLYTVYDGTKYYLHQNGTAVELSRTASTVWTDSGESLYVSAGTYNLHLQYYENEWQLLRCGTLTDEDGVILGSADGTTLDNETETVWTFDNADLTAGTHIAYHSGDTTKYLNITSTTTVALQDNKSTVWTMDSDGNLTCSYNGGTYHLYFYNGGKAGKATSAKLVRGCVTTANLGVASEASSQPVINAEKRYDAIQWNITVGSKIIFQCANHTSLYLSHSSNWYETVTLLLGSNTSWSFDTNGTAKSIYIESSLLKLKKRLRYDSDSGWELGMGGATDEDAKLYFLPWYATVEANDVQAASEPVQAATRGTQQPARTDTATDLTLTKVRVRDSAVLYHQEFWDYNRENVTYMPLTTDDSYQVEEGNTGYILGGSVSQVSETNNFPVRSGDIRFSRKVRSRLSPIIAYEYINNTSWSISSRYIEKALTIGKEGQAAVGSDTYKPSSFQRYSAAKKDFETTMQSDWAFYGLHFMAAKVNMNNLIPLSSATIEKATYANYEMPASSIDFQLQTRGFITFFAGTYYDGNNAFFSLYHIKRYKENIKEKGIVALAIYERNSTPVKEGETEPPARMFKCNDGEFYKWDENSNKFVRNKFTAEYYTQINSRVYVDEDELEEGVLTSPTIYSYQVTENNKTVEKYFTYDYATGTPSDAKLPEAYVDANKIEGINEIEKIFGVYYSDSDKKKIDSSVDFIYRYTNGEYSVELDEEKTVASENKITIYDDQGKVVTEYEMVFDTVWITDPTSSEAAGSSFNSSDGLYYFEIPANAGEYALGSVSQKTGETEKNGAYLLYLDIAANATNVYTQKITEVKQHTQYDYSYPCGTQLRAASQETDFDAEDSAAMALTKGGKLTVLRDVDSDKAYVKYEYTAAETGAGSNTTDSSDSAPVTPRFAGNGVELREGTAVISKLTADSTRLTVEEKQIDNQFQNKSADFSVNEEQKTTLTKDVTVNGTTTRTMTVTEDGKTYEVKDDEHTITVPTEEEETSELVLKTSSDLYTPLADRDVPLKLTSSYDYAILLSDGALNQYNSITMLFEASVLRLKLTVNKNAPGLISPSVEQFILDPAAVDNTITPYYCLPVAQKGNDMTAPVVNAAKGSTVTYQWTTSTTVDGTYTAISGATGETLGADMLEDGNYYKCEATYETGTEVKTYVNETGVKYEQITAAITNTEDILSVAVTPDGKTVTAYRWYVSDEGTTWTEAASTQTLAYTTGKYYKCDVTVSGGTVTTAVYHK